MIQSETLFIIIKKIILLIYLRLHWVFIAVCGLSLLVASRRYSVVVVHGRLTVAASLALGHSGSVVVAHGLSCPAACGIFPDQGSNSCPLHWQVGF